MTAGQVRIPRARLIVAAAAVIAGLAILWLSRDFNFYFDEWSFIFSAPDWQLISYFQPHNEHPSMLPRLIYAVLLNTVGLRSYVPYMAVLLALHGFNVYLLFELVRRRAGDLVGMAAAASLLFLGAGWENILWAFQISFVGSVACGLAMLLALESRRTLPAALLLLASLMFSGIGLVFLVAAAARLFFEPTRRRELLWLVPVAAAFVAWYLVFGHNGTPPNPPAALANLMVLPLYVAWGLASSAAALIGQGGAIFGPLVLVMAVVAIALGWTRRPPDAFAVSVALALVTFYVVTGVNRAQLGYQQSGAGRYVYEGALMWLLLLADPARELPWRGTWRPALVAAAFLMCFSSAALLYAFSVAKTAQMLREDDDFQALAAVRHDPCLNPAGAVDQLVIPQLLRPADYYRVVDLYGDPVAGRPLVGGPDFETAKTNLLKPGCG